MADINDDPQKHAQVQSLSSSATLQQQQQQQQPQPQEQQQEQPQLQQPQQQQPETNGHQALTLRLLMQGKEVGSIIGKKGDNIKKFREKSGAKINVSDSSCPDRVVTLAGTLNEVYSAFSMICLKFEEQLLQPNFVGSTSSSSNNNNNNSNNANSPTTTTATTTTLNNDTNNNNTQNNSNTTNSNSLLNNVVPSVIDPLFGLPMPAPECRIRSGLVLNSMNNNVEESATIKKETDMLTINNNSTSTINNNNITAPNKNLSSNANSTTYSNIAQHPSVTLRIIVPASQCGSLIGRGGAKIKEIREMTGASIQVAPDVLPNSTERVVTVSGNVESLKSCAYQICTIMVESPPKGYNIQYRPKPILNPMLIAAATAGQAAAAYNLPGQFLAAHPDVNRLFVASNPLTAAFNPAATAANLRAAATGQAAAALSAVASQTISSQEMAIPNGLIGCVIGKGGSKINEIRQLSGATIKISNPEEGAKNRTITINGTPEAINIAQYLINASCNGHQTSPLDSITKPWIANKSARKFAPY